MSYNIMINNIVIIITKSKDSKKKTSINNIIKNIDKQKNINIDTNINIDLVREFE